MRPRGPMPPMSQETHRNTTEQFLPRPGWDALVTTTVVMITVGVGAAVAYAGRWCTDSTQ